MYSVNDLVSRHLWGQILKDYQFLRPLLDHGLIVSMMEVLSGVLLIPSLNRRIWTLTMGQILKNYNCFTFFNKKQSQRCKPTI